MTSTERAISEELGDPRTTVARRRALLGELRGTATALSVPALRDHTQHSDVRCQAAAVFALAGIPDDAAVEALGDCLSMATGTRFTFAVRELGRRGGVRPREILLQTLTERAGELDSGDKRLLISALSATPHRSQVAALASVLGEDSSRRTRAAAATVLGQIRAPEASAALHQAEQSLRWWRRGPIRRARRRQEDS